MNLSDFTEITNVVPSDFEVIVEDGCNNALNVRRIVVDYATNQVIIQLEDDC